MSKVINLKATEQARHSARELANRANAQLSTGPRTGEGKSKSSKNAAVYNLTGSTVLLPSDDAAQYERHLFRFLAEHAPQSERERELVQALADTQWRLNRIPGLELGIFAQGRIQFAHLFLQEDSDVRAHLIENLTLTTNARQLNNLSIQESRLRRNFKSDLAELKLTQAARREREKAQKERKDAAKEKEAVAAPAHAAAATGYGSSDNDGFVFSSEMLNAFDSALNTDALGQGSAGLLKDIV